MTNQVIQISGLANHLFCPMQCHLHGVQISKVLKFLADSPSVSTDALQVTDYLNAAHPLMISLQLQEITSYFDVHSQSITENDNEDIPKIHFTADKPPWDPSTEEYSERDSYYRTLRTDHPPFKDDK